MGWGRGGSGTDYTCALLDGFGHLESAVVVLMCLVLITYFFLCVLFLSKGRVVMVDPYSSLVCLVLYVPLLVCLLLLLKGVVVLVEPNSSLMCVVLFSFFFVIRNVSLVAPYSSLVCLRVKYSFPVVSFVVVVVTGNGSM